MLGELKEKLARIGRQEAGFTLIELMIVIAVIGILVGIAIPKFRGVRNKAEVASVKSDLRNIQSGLEMYNAEHGEYPDDITNIDEYVTVDNISDYSENYSNNGDGYEVTKENVGEKTVKLTSDGITVDGGK